MGCLLQINVTANWGSTGKIAEDIGKLAIDAGWESWIAYGRGNPSSESKLIRIGNDWDMKSHALQSRLFDNHGLASSKVTKTFIRQIKEIKPDIIHLHNIHGYYLNYPLLFDFLKEYGAPVVWTLHDCWPFTGHCAYYDYAKCDKWRTQCHDCPQLRSYPASVWLDRTERNFNRKKDAFLSHPDITFVPVSDWLKTELSKSFLSDYSAITIHNGINLDIFKPSQNITKQGNEKVILGVASVWDKRKGLDEFVKLRPLLPDNYLIILVGLSQDQISSLPAGITGIRRTENVGQLVDLYSMADVFVNPTLEDNFPTTNLEALACGTPVITYETGGSPEAIDDHTGFVVPYQDVTTLAEKIKIVCEKHPFDSIKCRERAVEFYDKQKVFKEYINLYNQLLKQ
ncbi:glycosyltransferase [uncultured Duncaniella sp.]|uniref:glycosyltransferase n=1 Tax=uncultured Duncaniella sp. TaxID=2768039 RepID=UPI0026098369|nr:glycosyltransferase [uncultured Duncaniella sp.]